MKVAGLHRNKMTQLYIPKPASLCYAEGRIQRTFIFVATNPYHRMFYREIYFRESGGVRNVDFVMGEWYVVHGSYTSGVLILSLILVLIHLMKPSGGFKPQLIAVALGIALPICASLAYLLGLSPYDIDPVPVVLCITSALYAWAFLRADMLSILPVARDTVMESMGEGVLVMDADWRLLDSNRSARHLLPELERAVIGGSIRDLGLPAEASTAFRSALAEPGRPIPFARGTGTDAVYYEVYSAAVGRGSGRSGGHLLVLSNTTEHRNLQEQLHRMASLDSLTGILNRGAFLANTAEALAASVREQKPCSRTLFDLDHFKVINDTYGHEAGDAALLKMVEVCRERLEPGMLFARYGGEEFILLLPGLNGEQVVELAESIRQDAEQAELITTDGRIVRIRASFGAATVQDGRQADYQEMFRRADLALYRAKEEGRNRVCLADPL
ncbi:histidine kinase N-terminal 7TM domain-containing diguanylate cyclase [Paenibacillus herberti]|uniref:GGDEF domain-containing protein n=1 Tax=Paenibacillus herberti TaxID=1619309 RepID=A0A229NXF5_9BACL|nr:diguanylate cyclase [Paenibacillus herberti]OXM14309.1 hypothetical protein CGZ75_15255 [Paenibacillus herberti]